MGAAAAVEAAVDEPPLVPNLSCRRRTSRGGLATEFTNAILTCRPAGTDTTLNSTCDISVEMNYLCHFLQLIKVN